MRERGNVKKGRKWKREGRNGDSEGKSVDGKILFHRKSYFFEELGRKY